MSIECRSAGYFDIKIVRPDGSIRDRLKFQNLVTNIGLERMGSNNDYINYCRVGVGSTQPQFTDTQLENQIASVVNLGSTFGASSEAPYYGWVRRTFTFAEGVASGVLSEVGIGWSASGTTLFSRSLFLDQDGDPTTITVLNDEILVITYEHRYYVPIDDWTGSVTLQGNLGGTYGVVGRSSRVTSDLYTSANKSQDSYNEIREGAYNAGIGSITSGPTGTRAQPNLRSASSSGATATHIIGWNYDAGNLPGGIVSVDLIMGNSAFQFQFDPPIPKTADDKLELNFKLTWGRYEGGD